MRLIDADALERVLDMIPCADIKNMDGQAYVLVRLSQVYNVIKNAPTIEPERKQGKWISFGKVCNCSVCYKGYDNTHEFVEEWNYCPNCGAKMER